MRINVGPGYDVRIGRGLIDSCGVSLAAVAPKCRVAVVTDSTVKDLYLSRAVASLERAGFDCVSFAFPAGEGSKNISTLSNMLEFFAESRLTRSDLVVALGGGVVGDMAGFAAGIYQRGVRYAQIPTTLLAAVDSSVGGKTAVNLAAGKNLAGVFNQPILVQCDTDTLLTLPPETFADGAAESIKYGVLTDERIFSLFAEGDVNSALPEIISRCVSIKGALVERDELDNGDRRFLNLGHTIGHAIENVSGYTFPHGHAVAVGMVMIARAGERMSLSEAGLAERIAAVLRRNGLPTSVPYTPEELLPAALSDKKRSGGVVTLVMPLRIGECVLKPVPVSELGEIIRLGKEG